VIEVHEAVGIGDGQGFAAGVANDLLSEAPRLDAVGCAAGDERE